MICNEVQALLNDLTSLFERNKHAFDIIDNTTKCFATLDYTRLYADIITAYQLVDYDYDDEVQSGYEY